MALPTCAILIVNWKVLPGRDVIVLPEMFTSGFAMEAAASSLAQNDVVNWMTAKAQRCNALIAGSVAYKRSLVRLTAFCWLSRGGTVHFYDKRHLFRMADEHLHYKAGNARVIVEWRGWRILPLVCYDLRFPVWSRNLNDYDLALYVANWPAPRSLHWQALLTAARLRIRRMWRDAIASAAMATAAIIVGDSRVINPQGEIIATADAHQATRIDAELSMVALREYREKFPAWRDADEFNISLEGEYGYEISFVAIFLWNLNDESPNQ
ncbi:putative carbon-nitrogen hydrolase [Escherichia coli]|uniref:Omega-amidase YafV n=1 Tax=Escherichia coli TaxID=562 RepID=A0A376LIN1_ECOLX|nr:putative carbon-nitrogen hydrolase [Escherichia coli]